MFLGSVYNEFLAIALALAGIATNSELFALLMQRPS